MAVHRRQPTGSDRKIAAAMVMASGKACKIAVTLAKGIYFKAVKKATIVHISAVTRKKRRRLLFADKSRIATSVIPTNITTGGTELLLIKNIA